MCNIRSCNVLVELWYVIGDIVVHDRAAGREILDQHGIYACPTATIQGNLPATNFCFALGQCLLTSGQTRPPCALQHMQMLRQSCGCVACALGVMFVALAVWRSSDGVDTRCSNNSWHWDTPSGTMVPCLALQEGLRPVHLQIFRLHHILHLHKIDLQRQVDQIPQRPVQQHPTPHHHLCRRFLPMDHPVHTIWSANSGD